MTNPTLITTPFAENGDKNIIPESVGANPQNATMQAGFPPITQQKISEGGIPPERNDFNGILNLYGQHIVHLNKGLPYEFDQAFADAIGGYPLNSSLMLDNGDIVKSTVPNNTANPNVDMTGWVKTNSADQIVDSSGKTQQQINDITLHEFNVLNYGADPTGVSNSHDAFVACAQALSLNGSGKYVVPYGNYLVGKQTKQDSAIWRMFGEYLVDLRELDTVVIELQGCKLKNKDGIYFGQFDANLNPINAPSSVPSRCSGGIMFNLIGNKSVKITGSAELDGNLTNAIIGGNYGDYGIQIEYDGFYTNGNMHLSNEATITTRDFGRDGYYIGARYLNKNNVLVEFTDNDILPYSVLKNFTAILNARQGLSFTGGSGSVEDCHFEKIGKGRLTQTLPQAGIDLEQESGVLRDVKIIRSTFVDCGGIGLVNTSGVLRRDSYIDCRFVGNTNYSLYAASGIFERCYIVGRAGIGGTDSTFKDRNNIPTFKKCVFSSRSIDAAGGPVYGSSFLLETIFPSPAKSYALFDQCDFYATDGFIFAGANAAFTFNKCKFYVASENAANGLRSQFLKCSLIDCEFIDLRENPINTLTIGRDNNDPSVIWNNVSITSNTEKLAFSFVSGVGTVSQRQQDIFAKHSLVLANNSATVVTSPTSRAGTIAIYSKSALPTVPTDQGNPFYVGDIIKNWAATSSSWTEAVCITGGYSCSATWAASTAYALNAYVSANGKVYQATVAGTSGTTAPSHTSGTATDGSVTWQYIGTLAVFRQTGIKATGLTASSTAADIVASLKAAGIAT